MTPREIFDKVKAHLLTQRAKAEDQGFGSTCMYRSSEGLKCAVGCLIPDEAYTTKAESTALYQLDILQGQWIPATGWSTDERVAALCQMLTRSSLPADEGTQRLLKRLQEIHDDALVSDWPTLLDQLEAEMFPEEIK